MSRHFAARLAWAVWTASLVFVVAGVSLYAASTRHLPGGSPYLLNLSVSALGFSTVGALVASRRPWNSVGWLFAAVGILYGFLAFTGEYSVHAVFLAPGLLPGGVFALWLASWLWVLVGQLSLAVFLFFPDGRLPSPRWRVVAALMLVGILTSSASFALRPGSLLEADPRELPLVENPLALESAAALGLIDAVSLPLALLAPAPLVALFVRYRRSRGDERQQIKWVAYAAALLTVAAVVVSVFPSLDGTALGGAMFLVAYVAVPAAVGVAILRYRLYDIDVIINRTLVYTALTVMLVVIYLGGVVLSQGILRALTGQESQLAVVGSTLLIAMLFNPMRLRIHGFVDRLFYRKKYDAQRTLREFGARLRYRTDLESLDEELISTVRETMQPEHVSVWLRMPSVRRYDSTIGEVER